MQWQRFFPLCVKSKRCLLRCRLAKGGRGHPLTIDDMTVIAEVGSEQQLLKDIDVYNDVDVELVDAALIALKRVASLSQLKRLYPNERIVILSSYFSDSFIRRLFEDCGSAYCQH